MNADFSELLSLYIDVDTLSFQLKIVVHVTVSAHFTGLKL